MNGNRDNNTNSIISVRVQTRASKNEISEIEQNGKIRIRLTSPPLNGKANIELVRFLGKVLGTAQSNLEIVRGERSRDKLISVSNIDQRMIRERLNESVRKK